MQVSKEEILHIAKLANLNLQDEEVDKYQHQLEDILDFADVIKNAPIEGISETIELNDLYNVFRKDEIINFQDREKLLQNAPEQQMGMFKIPKVM